jgi:hypothetical protein
MMFACFRAAENVLFITTKAHCYYVGARERILCAFSFKQVLAHELIHARNCKEDFLAALDRGGCAAGLLDPDLGNQEEQRAICGIAPFFPNNSQGLFLCENVFLRAWGMALRVNHCGLRVFSPVAPPAERFDLAHMIVAKAHGSIERILARNASEANGLYELSWIDKSFSDDRLLYLANKKMRPLSIAAARGDEKTAALLIRHGAIIEAKDDGGGPISVARQCGEEGMAAKLVLWSSMRSVRAARPRARSLRGMVFSKL